MSWLEAVIMGLIQGLTEFLPVSSDGHLEIAKVLLGVGKKDTLLFTIVVHAATVLSTIVVFRKDILSLAKETLKFQWNDSTKYILKLIVSMIPVAIVGFFFMEEVESLFTGRVVLVGYMWVLTALFLYASYIRRKNTREISYLDSFIMGIAQAAAVLPGLSRSATTISTGLMLGNKKEDITRFSFLMVLVPIIGAFMKDLLDAGPGGINDIGVWPLVIGFLVAFVTGLLACSWMISIVKKGKLIYFAVYCTIVGILAIILG
jgi:undecaprenyl-diphosphatase